MIVNINYPEKSIVGYYDIIGEINKGTKHRSETIIAN